MRKIIAAISVLALALSLAGCGTAKLIKNESSANVEKQEVQKDSIQEIKSGEKIVTDNYEIVINDVELTYDVLPDDTSGFYTHYEAETGKVYISVDADVTNKGKQNLRCDKIGKVTADYNSGYIYRGFVVVDDSSTGFTYANITSITPLETRGIKWLIECPQEVDETTNALFLEFTVNGETFVYNVR